MRLLLDAPMPRRRDARLPGSVGLNGLSISRSCRIGVRAFAPDREQPVTNMIRTVSHQAGVLAHPPAESSEPTRWFIVRRHCGRDKDQLAIGQFLERKEHMVASWLYKVSKVLIEVVLDDRDNEPVWPIPVSNILRVTEVLAERSCVVTEGIDAGLPVQPDRQPAVAAMLPRQVDRPERSYRPQMRRAVCPHPGRSRYH